MTDREDFHAFIASLGLTMEQVMAMESLPYFDDDLRVRLGPSSIDRRGAFVDQAILEGDRIVARRRGEWSLLGRFANHSQAPTCDVVIVDGDICFIAREYMTEGVELTVNYRHIKQALDALNGDCNTNVP